MKAILSISIAAVAISAVLSEAAPVITTLDNGMEVMLIENHSNPVIASVVVVRTGNRNESLELNGATHFLEHLLFNGTESRTQQELYDEMDFLGGYNNANTASDRTTFMILLEKSNFEKGLEIQADMLFHSVLPPDKFEKEKGIVIEEIGKDEDSEDYRVERFFDQIIFRGTPYQWPILGSRQSIRRLTRDQVYQYYRTFYVPNNMAALIMGDFETEAMLKTVNRVFGKEAPGTLPAQDILYVPAVDQAQQFGAAFFLNQGVAQHTYMRLALPAPPRSSPDYFAYLVVSRLLSDRLERDLKGNPAAAVLETGVNLFMDRDFGVLQIDLKMDAARDIHPALEAFHQSVTEFSKETPDAKRIAAVVTALRAEDLYNAERPHYYGMLKAEDLAQGGPYFVLDYQSRLAAVTPEDVARVLKDYLQDSYPVVAVYQAILPEEGEGFKTTEARILERTFPNGLTVAIEQNQDSKVFAAHFLFKDRSAAEKELGAPAGTVDFIHHLFDYGPADSNQEAFQSALQALGAQVKFYDMAFIPYDDYYTTPEFSYVRLEALDENYSDALALVTRCIRQPHFTEDAVEAVRGQMLSLAKRNQGSVSQSGKNLFAKLIYGDSPLAAGVVGESQGIASLTMEQLQSFHAAYFAPNRLILTIVTSRDAEEVLQRISEWMGDWRPTGSPVNAEYPRPTASPRREEQTGGKEQSYLSLGYTFELKQPEDRAPLTILNAILSERMQFQLREKEGLAYTLGSSISFYPGWGVWTAGMGTGPQNLVRAEQGILEEVSRAKKETFTEHDVQKAKNAYLGRLLLRGLSRINQAYQMGWGLFKGEGVHDYSAWIQNLQNVSPSEVTRVAREYLKTDGMTVAIVK
jgi:predicted Zn-dependent peptidase